MQINNPTLFRNNLRFKYAKKLECKNTKCSFENQQNPDCDIRADKILDILEDNEKHMKIAINLEKAIFNYCIKEAITRRIVKKWENPQFVQLYLDRSRTIFANLKSSKIKEELKTGEITPQQFGFMTHQEMKPEHWSEYLTAKSKRDALKYTNTVQASTDLFTCRKCKSKKCTYYELQTRSADEPTSIFVQCIDCGKSWREQ